MPGPYDQFFIGGPPVATQAWNPPGKEAQMAANIAAFRLKYSIVDGQDGIGTTDLSTPVGRLKAMRDKAIYWAHQKAAKAQFDSIQTHPLDPQFEGRVQKPTRSLADLSL